MSIQKNDNYPLHKAAADGDVYKLNQLLRDGEDKEKPDKRGLRPLHLAALHNHPLIALALVKAGVDLDSYKTNGLHGIESGIHQGENAQQIAERIHGEDSVIALFLKGAMERKPKTPQEQADELLSELDCHEMMNSSLHGEFIRKLLVALGIAR